MKTAPWSIAFLAAAVIAVSPRLAPAAQPMNIVVFLTDDMNWNDLPYFSAPYDDAAYPSNLPQPPPGKGERRLISPDWNRFAARTLAASDGSFGTFTLPTADGGQVQYEVTPIDQSHGYTVGGGATQPCRNPRALCSECNNCSGCCTPDPANPESCCVASGDVLPGFGGLGRLAREGLVFSRFYSSTAKCAPARAAFMTGRYPSRVGLTLNGGKLRPEEVTISEFLKQGCGGTGTDYEHQCFDGESYSRCPCYLDDPAQCDAMACYHTGLIGKWHLGAVRSSPWAHGFDEYLGFGGSSRYAWDTTPLICSPAPSYCPDFVTQCTRNADCGGALCRQHSLYVGTKQSFNDCDHPLDNGSANCCDKPKVIGAYRMKQNVATTAEHGKDNRTNAKWPCSDDSPSPKSHCAHLTRILRDQARNFIVRNANRPYFLTVAPHDAHDPENAPIRTENHYLTTAEGRMESLRPAAPFAGAMHWAGMEEVDSMVGQVLTLLDRTGVCENDATVACANDGDCAGKCIGIGRCSAGDEVVACLKDADCGAAGGQCEPQSKHTIVMFFTDQGSPKVATAYGDPDLRGGKGDVYEGGVRVGLLARGPWSAGATDAVASVIDVFATVAEAAGYDLQNGRVGQVTSRYCSNTNARCREDADCGTGTCRAVAGSTVTVDSRSFLPLLADPAANGAARDLTYASFPSAGAAVITRDDYLRDNQGVASAGKGVCAYENMSPGPVRKLHGGSCETCDPNACVPGEPGCSEDDPAHPDYCRSKRCKLPAKVCVSTDTAAPAFVQACDVTTGLKRTGSRDYCARFEPVPVPTSSAETYRALYRCETATDCPRTDRPLQCLANVWTSCDRCVGAAWKLKANPNPGKTLLTGLFDLKSNPEEEERLNFRFQGCDDSKPDILDNPEDLDANEIRVRNVIQTLKTDDASAIERWIACVNSDCAQPY